MSPRIPIYSPQAQLGGLPTPGAPRLMQPDYSGANTLREGLKGIGAELEKVPTMVGATAGGEYAQAKAKNDAIEKARQEAAGVAEASATLEFNRRIQARLNGDSAAGTQGFLTTKGFEASEKSAETLKGFENDRSEVAEGLSDPDARQRFLLRSSEALLAYRKQLEGHVDKEFGAAKAATLKGLEEQALSMVEGGIQDTDAYVTITNQTEQLLRENVPREAGEAAVMDFRSKAAQALILGQLAQGDVASAVQLVDGMKGRLGSRYLETKAQVDRANVGRQKDLKAAAITKQVETWALEARDANGYVRENTLRAKAGASAGHDVQVPDEDREAYDKALNKKAKEEEQRLKNDIGEHQKVAELADLEDRPIPGASVAFLSEYDPHFLRGLRAQRRARENADRIARSGSAGSKADARRAQDAIDEEAANLFAAELEDNPNADPDEFLRQFVADKADRGLDVYVTDAGRSGLVKSGAKAQTRAQKEDSSLDRYVKAGLRDSIAKATPPPKKGKARDESLQRSREGAAFRMYEERVAQNGGKPLDPAQVSQLNADVVRMSRMPDGSMGMNVDRPTFGPAAPPVVQQDTLRRFTPKQQQAYKWAKENPDDPMSEAILKKLRVK